MAEVLLFHHAQGLTPGVVAFADELRAAGHTVHTPDLFDGKTFGSIDEGMAYIKEQGFDELRKRGVATADAYPNELVYAGMSFGESIAQELAQTRPGRPWGAALLFGDPDQRRVGVRALAGRRPGPDPRHGQRPDLRGRGRHRGRAGDRRQGRGRGALPVPGRPALLLGQLAAVV